MGVLDSFGSLVSAIVASIVMLAFAILSVFVMVFIVDVAAGIAGMAPDEDGFVVLAAAILAAAAIVAGGTGLTLPEGEG